MTPVNFDVPAGACDCHTHIFGDPKAFPFFAGRVYTPPPAVPEQMAALHQALRIQRVVIVAPSVYGTDNAATLYGMKARGKDARGVAVIDEKTPEADLDRMGQAGVRGIRLNLATAGINDPAVADARLRQAIARISARKWHIQINTNLAMIAALETALASSPVPIVVDHFGGAQAALGERQPGFAELVRLVQSGRAYVKISAAYRSSTRAPDYADIVPLAKALIAANADRVLWATDWPHPDPVAPPGRPPTDVTPLLVVDDGHLLNQLPVWAPEAVVRRKILVDNPARFLRILIDWPRRADNRSGRGDTLMPTRSWMTLTVWSLAAILLHAGDQAKRPPGGYIVQHDAEVARPEPGPHAGGGQTVGHSFFRDVPGLSLVFRKRALKPGSGSAITSRPRTRLYVLSGRGEMTLDGKKVDVGPGTAILTRTGSSHGLKVVGSDDLVIIINYVQAPK